MKEKISDSYISLRSLPKNFQKQDEHLFRNEYKRLIPSAHVNTLSSVIVINGDVLFHLWKLRTLSEYTHFSDISARSFIRKLSKSLNGIRIIANAVWISNEYSFGYFHWITECLIRLVMIEKAGRKSSICVLLPSEYKKLQYVNASLKYFDVNVIYFSTKQLVFAKALSLPSHPALTGNYNKELINILRKRLLEQQREVVPWRKLYINRSLAQRRTVENEDKVLELILALGFEEVYFEKLDFWAQVEIVNECRVLIGLHGAGLTNMLFMRSGGKVLELRNKEDSNNNCYFTLASELDLDYYYQVSESDNIDTYDSNITVDLELLERNILLMEGN